VDRRRVRAIAARTWRSSCSRRVTVKKAITGNGRAEKKQVAAVVVSLYPELKAYLHGESKWKQRFRFDMFDAVAVGLTAKERSMN